LVVRHRPGLRSTTERPRGVDRRAAAIQRIEARPRELEALRAKWHRVTLESLEVEQCLEPCRCDRD
jgi:hypothetical protein